MNAIAAIMVVMDPALRRNAALRRGIELARRSGAVLHLYLFDHDPMIQIYGEDLEEGVRRAAITHFLDQRLQRLNAIAAEVASGGVRVECDVVWAPATHQAIVARAIDIRPELVIKNVDESAPHGLLLRPIDWKLLRLVPADLMLVHGDSGALPRRIVAAVDTCDSATHPAPLNEAVVRGALRIGRYAEAELHLAHVAPYIPAGGLVDSRMQLSYETMVERDVAAFRRFAQGLQVPGDRCHMLSGETATSLKDFSGRIGADLLAIGSVYRSAWDRFMLGTTAEQLLAESGRDILMVKEPEFESALRHHVDLDAWRQATLRYRG
ncbi:MAG TPA: universal stress protein [Solimonas sp.]|nr:universal stress protein [Solimonas sp.]